MLRMTLSNKDKALANKQTKFLEAVQGIGDILVFDTKHRNQNKEVLTNLKKLTDLVRDLFALRDRDPEKFDRMVLAERLLKLIHSKPDEAQFRLTFDPRESLIAFSTALGQIMRVHEAALEASNDELSRYATYHLSWLLSDLAQRPNCAIFIEQILRELQTAMRAAAPKEGGSAYAAASDWYVDIVFKDLRGGGKFQLDYLPLFDRYFLFSIDFVITENYRKLYEALISSLVDGVMLTPDMGEVWEYGHLVLNSDFQKYQALEAAHHLERRIQDLANSERQINSKETLGVWLSKFEELKALLTPNLSVADRARALEKETAIREHAREAFSRNHLLLVAFKIGVYALARSRPDYVRYLWDYKQPPDSDARWIGHDIVPTTVPEVLGLYFRRELLHSEFSAFQGHRSLVPYAKRYFLLLLARLLQAGIPSGPYDFTGWDASNLSDAAHMLRELLPLAKEMALERELHATLGLDKNIAAEVFADRVVSLLSSVADLADEQIASLERETPTSPAKIAEFRALVLKEYERLASVRSIFQLYNHFVDQTATSDGAGLPRWGINTVDAKAAFFEKWYVNYLRWGTNYGERMALSEDTALFTQLATKAKPIDPLKLDETILGIGPSAIILATRMALLQFQMGARFQATWQINPENKPGPESFAGWYLVGEQRIPVYTVHLTTAQKRVMILSSTSLGKLHQFTPLDPEDKTEDLAKHMLIKVDAFSENPSLMAEALNDPPEWLKKYEGEVAKLDYLKLRVRIQVCERFELRLPDNFIGWIYDDPRK